MKEKSQLKHSIDLLRREWDLEEGFLGGVRLRKYDPERLERLAAVLKGIDAGDGDNIDRELVRLLWFIPLFLEWQKPSFQESGKDPLLLDSAIHRVVNELYRILGVP